MKDTQGNNLAANEVGKLNEMTTTTTETAAVSKEATVESVAAGKMTKEEILNKLRNMVEEPVSAVRDEIDSLKQAYYKIRKAEIEELKKTFVEQGGNVKDFNVPEDKYEALLKDLMNTFKEKRAAQIAEEEKNKSNLSSIEMLGYVPMVLFSANMVVSMIVLVLTMMNQLNAMMG